MLAVAHFTVDVFQPEPPFVQDGGLSHARIHVEKTFTGDLEGQGRVEMLAGQADQAAGYVALERITGRLGGREGGFSLLHMGLREGDQTSGQWPVVPGSGTGELTGIRGQGRIEIDAQGQHTFTLDYELA
jgi:uncharacterized protein DUF3224